MDQGEKVRNQAKRLEKGWRAVYLRRRSELPTTSKLLVAIAAAAIMGLMKPKAARGTEIRL